MKQPKDDFYDFSSDLVGYYAAIHKNLNDILATHGKPPVPMLYFGTLLPTAAELNQERLWLAFDDAIDALLRNRP